jgi:pimeloyl-ACP methyl ester carboxylesterase
VEPGRSPAAGTSAPERPLERWQLTVQQIPGARMVTVKDAGHFLPLDQPDAVVQQIGAFSRELQTNATVSP